MMVVFATKQSWRRGLWRAPKKDNCPVVFLIHWVEPLYKTVGGTNYHLGGADITNLAVLIQSCHISLRMNHLKHSWLIWGVTVNSVESPEGIQPFSELRLKSTSKADGERGLRLVMMLLRKGISHNKCVTLKKQNMAALMPSWCLQTLLAGEAAAEHFRAFANRNSAHPNVKPALLMFLTNAVNFILRWEGGVGGGGAHLWDWSIFPFNGCWEFKAVYYWPWCHVWKVGGKYRSWDHAGWCNSLDEPREGRALNLWILSSFSSWLSSGKQRRAKASLPCELEDLLWRLFGSWLYSWGFCTLVTEVPLGVDVGANVVFRYCSFLRFGE